MKYNIYIYVYPLSSLTRVIDEYLAGGFKHEFYFPFHIWDVILPIDVHIFQDGYCTTNQSILQTHFLLGFGVQEWVIPESCMYKFTCIFISAQQNKKCGVYNVRDRNMSCILHVLQSDGLMLSNLPLIIRSIIPLRSSIYWSIYQKP